MTPPACLLCLSLVLCVPVSSHKLLLFPYSQGFSSHLLDLLKIGTLLKDAGHDVTFLVASNTKTRVEQEGFCVLTYPVPPGVSHELDLSELMPVIFERSAAGQMKLLTTLSERFVHFCGSFLEQKDLHLQLQQEGFDLVLYDKTDFCHFFLQEILHIPAIVYYAVGYARVDRAHYPPSPSFIPGTFTKYSDDMTFTQRLMNLGYLMIFWGVSKFLLERDFERLSKEHGMPYDLDITSKSLHMVQGNFALDFARPLMPNIISIGGIFDEPGKPLTLDLEEFIQGSGHHGIIVVCFGTLIPSMDHRAEKFARAFARLPQKVIWRYSSKAPPPPGLGNNTLLLDWLPQNDLLAHPRTRAFISHCGMSSTQEAATHAVPVVAMPVFGDQFQNMQKLVTKAQMGIPLDFHDFTEEELYQAITELISNPHYKRRAVATSELLHSQPVPPSDLLLHYVDQVAGGHGVQHLLQPALWRMTFIELHMLDVGVVCLGVVLLLCWGTATLCRHCCCRPCDWSRGKEKLN